MSVVSVKQLSELHNQIAAGRVDGPTLQRFLEYPNLYQEHGRFGLVYPIVVNRDLGLERLVAETRHPWLNVDRRINEPSNFPIEGTGIREVKVEFYEFEETVDGLDAEYEIEKNGYQLEDLPEALALVKLKPIEQLRRPIVVIGHKSRLPEWPGKVSTPHLVPCFDRDDDQRYLGLRRFENKFDTRYRFLVSRKPARNA